jgi:nucleoside-diphosphate kinase
MENVEFTFIAVKHDGVQRGLMGNIISRFEKKGLTLVEAKFFQPSKELIYEHYEEHKHKDIFEEYCRMMYCGPVLAMVWSGPEGTIQAVRKLIGKGFPLLPEVGSIRGEFSIVPERNVVHASANLEEAKKEVELWFKNKTFYLK